MRISAENQATIRETAHEIFGPDITLMVFGSRVDDNARGGDLDLLVKSVHIIPQRRRKSLQLVARLQRRLGDQPIDVLVFDPKTPRNPVYEQALSTGVVLE